MRCTMTRIATAPPPAPAAAAAAAAALELHPAEYQVHILRAARRLVARHSFLKLLKQLNACDTRPQLTAA